MNRLIEGMGKNSPEEYDAIYQHRKMKGIDGFDMKRWKKLLQYYRGGRLIDLGCLDSMVPFYAKTWYPEEEVWAIDLAMEAISDMAQRFPEVLFQYGSVYDTKFPSNYFAYATAGELIEHLDDPEKFFKEAFRILKRGGMLALSTPLEETHAGEVDHERHLWSFNEKELEKLLKPYGTLKFKTLRSQFFPTYSYHFPNIIAYVKKT